MVERPSYPICAPREDQGGLCASEICPIACYKHFLLLDDHNSDLISLIDDDRSDKKRTATNAVAF